MTSFATYTRKLMGELGIEGLDPSKVDEDTSLWDDLAMDSFDAVRLVVLTELMSGILIPDIPLPELFTMGDAYAYFRQLSARAAEQADELI